MATMGKVEVGRSAPNFTCTAVVDGRLKEASLNSYTEAHHWLILIFFPKAWSVICPTEIRAFSARLEEFLYSRSCAVVFASTDSEHCLKAWNATSAMEGGLGGVHIPPISDCNHKLSRDYGVLNEEEGTAQRALFMIDPKGVVRSITVNDADDGRSVDEAQRVLDALVFKDEYGEDCGVDWKKGDKDIDITDKSHVEGSVDLYKKSWSDWARPKLTRAWSGTSQRSVSSNIVNRLRADSNDRVAPPSINGGNSGYYSALSSGQQSPLISPTSAMSVEGRRLPSPMEPQLDEAIIQQRVENLQAAMQNRGQSQGVGVAN